MKLAPEVARHVDLRHDVPSHSQRHHGKSKLSGERCQSEIEFPYRLMPAVDLDRWGHSACVSRVGFLDLDERLALDHVLRREDVCPVYACLVCTRDGESGANRVSAATEVADDAQGG
jgi:hypothetical protein